MEKKWTVRNAVAELIYHLDINSDIHKVQLKNVLIAVAEYHYQEGQKRKEQ